MGGGGGGVGRCSGWGGQGGCEVFVKIQKKIGWGWGGRMGGWVGWGVRVDVNEELKFLWKLKKKFEGGGGLGWGGGGGGGGQGGCERRIEVFEKIHKRKINFFFWGGGGHGRCEQRSEVFVNIKKKQFFLGG